MREQATPPINTFGASTVERWFYTAKDAAGPLAALAHKIPSHAGTQRGMQLEQLTPAADIPGRGGGPWSVTSPEVSSNRKPSSDTEMGVKLYSSRQDEHPVISIHDVPWRSDGLIVDASGFAT
jgi:hypothetical protein